MCRPWGIRLKLGRNEVCINPELEFELTQTQMTQKSMLRVEVYARALRANQNVKRAKEWWARDSPYEWVGRGRVREWKALEWDGVISERVGFLCVALPRGGFV
jgi:hypothetical protein